MFPQIVWSLNGGRMMPAIAMEANQHRKYVRGKNGTNINKSTKRRTSLIQSQPESYH
jgi:hypothetical protein